MNRSLLIFSILLILLGLGLDAYILSIFGVLLLFPALLTTPRPRPQGNPTGSGQQVPESTPQPTPELAPEQVPEPTSEQAPVMKTALEPVPVWGTVSAPVAPRTVARASMPPLPPSLPSFSAPLFPTSMFPSMFPSASQQIPEPKAPKEARIGAPDSRDDVLELGALLALMKLVFG